MGLFNWLKKEQPKKQAETTSKEAVEQAVEATDSLLLAMPMFEKGEKYSIEAVLAYLTQTWGYEIEGQDYDDTTAVLTTQGTMFAIAFMPAPIPENDVQHSAQFAYNWETVLEDIQEVDSHAIVSVVSGAMDVVERHLLLSRILFAIMATTPACVGVYQGSQTLLIPREQYLDYAQELEEGKVVVPLWIYIGLRTTTEGNSLYTYGLSGFGKQEIEIVNSPLALDELYGFLVNICSYVIGSDVVLQHGETLGYTAEQKINITSSAGVFVEGQTLKLAM
ncbi:DUF4261 domain-containing protein [Myroides sp. DF42-4-2]|uniref:DUF4261 domain-containing protein n=1 Tax=unclassified Myroides TaxID=2642485 RepID=UPI0025787EC8|nr:DUF4261 domain-containing protein [Myroides sp. DF42-4-2]MDM1407777.1 DUF4261 domain-containing protein [Myroides sp. DF42-4-2]